jgi:hypothetical protein
MDDLGTSERNEETRGAEHVFYVGPSVTIENRRTLDGRPHWPRHRDHTSRAVGTAEPPTVERLSGDG